MESILERPERVGAFTSSDIYRLMGSHKVTGKILKPFETYVQEKIREAKLGRSINVGGYSQAGSWGNLMEQYVFDEYLGNEYALTSKETKVHPDISTWAGSKDVIVHGVKVGDIKCYYPNNFSQYADVLIEKDVDLLREEYPKEYWQLVSNCAIEDIDTAEVILWIPYQSELEDIRNYAADYNGNDQWKYRWIYESEDYNLPYIHDASVYSNLYKFDFKVPKEDFELIHERVYMASKQLIEGLKR